MPQISGRAWPEPRRGRKWMVQQVLGLSVLATSSLGLNLLFPLLFPLAMPISKMKLVVTERLLGMNVKEPWRSLDFCRMKMIFICPGASLWTLFLSIVFSNIACLINIDFYGSKYLTSIFYLLGYFSKCFSSYSNPMILILMLAVLI